MPAHMPFHLNAPSPVHPHVLSPVCPHNCTPHAPSFIPLVLPRGVPPVLVLSRGNPPPQTGPGGTPFPWTGPVTRLGVHPPPPGQGHGHHWGLRTRTVKINTFLRYRLCEPMQRYKFIFEERQCSTRPCPICTSYCQYNVLKLHVQPDTDFRMKDLNKE